MRLWHLFGLLMIVVVMGNGIATAQDGNSINAVTADYTNFREHPSLNGTVISILDPNTPILLLARDATGEWVQGDVNGVQGWVFYTLVITSADLRELPTIIVEDVPPPSSATTDETLVGEGDVSATTLDVTNFRSGPSTGYGIRATLTAQTTMTLTGRNTDASWVQASVNGVVGWIYAPLVQADTTISTLPVVEAPPLTAETTTNANAPAAVDTTSTASPPTSVVSGVGVRSQQIYARGQQMGNRANVFSKVGDSISTSPEFLYPVGVGGLRLGGYSYLQPTVDYFSTATARTHNSFANDSIAVRSGWTTFDILSPANSRAGVCQPGETPLECEYRVVRPAFALIMIGTNDIRHGVTLATYQANLQQIVTISIEMGVVPVVSTVPFINDGVNGGRVAAFNNAIRSIAAANAIPLWDYYAAIEGLPNYGLSSDNVHPSSEPQTAQTAIFEGYYLTFGYNMRNLTALQVLDVLRRQVAGA